MLASGPETDCLFVYGSLMPFSAHPMALRLAAESAPLGAATVSGRLYDLGRYPGAVPSGETGDRVRGVVVRLRDPAMSLRWLDDYEGCGEDAPEPHAYQRVIASASLQLGRETDAWIYHYRWPLGEARHIESGCYATYKPLLALDF